MRVTFRAQFQGRKGLLDTGAFKFPNPPVETIDVYRSKDRWLARTALKIPLVKLPEAPNHGTMKDTVAENFEKQLTPWSMLDSDGNILDAKRISEDPKGNFTAQAETHIAHESQIGQPGNNFKTVCGITVPSSQIRSKRGHTPPDCGACKVEWAKVKTTERIA